MTNIQVDFQKKLGKIKPMHGVGQAPLFPGGTDYSMFHYLTEAHIPFSRLHDVCGFYGCNRFVDIPNLFRDFDADPYDPNSYDFAFTDMLITALVESGVEPFFRLGVTIENDMEIKAYRIHPPKDFKKWAIICEHIIRHYTEGWANGFCYKITYWEIWNEPENHDQPTKNQMWTGTKEQFYELYDVASTHLKAKFPHLKFGGYASCGFYQLSDTFVPAANSTSRYEYFITFFEGFLEYLKEHKCPLDFFSWHNYDTVRNYPLYADYARKRLDEIGYTHTETSCNEWNSKSGISGTPQHAAENTAVLIAMQNSCLDNSMFYDGRMQLKNPYSGLFNAVTEQPFPLYYGFKGYGDLYVMGTQAELFCDNDAVYALAATNGTEGGILIANIGEDTPLTLSINGKVVSCRLTDETHTDQEVVLPHILPKHAVMVLKVV